MALVPSNGTFSLPGEHAARAQGEHGAFLLASPANGAVAPQASSELQCAPYVGHKRIFERIEEDRSFMSYARVNRGLLPCPYQVKDGHVHFTILSNGALLSDVPGYHTNDSLYPVGYKGLRTFPSMLDPSKVGDFEFEIRYGGIFPQGGPLFCVRQFDYPERLTGFTPDEVWGKVVQKLREAGYQWKKGANGKDVNGHALFGLTSSVVIQQLESLPSVQDCVFYKPTGTVSGAVSIAAGPLTGKAEQDRARLIKLQENYLQKQEQFLQRLEVERKREEAKEMQRLEKERHKALMEVQREQQRAALEKLREEDRQRRAEADAKRKIMQKAHGRQILIDDMELIEIRRNHEKGEGEDAPERERGRVGVKASCFPIPHRVESISELSENIRGAEDLIPDLLEVWELVSFFAVFLECPSATCGVTFWEFCKNLEHPGAHLLHRLHIVLVRELFKDFPASDKVFLGRPLNALTWPELLRHYLEMMMLEHEDEGLEVLSMNMELEEMCDELQTEVYEELPFRRKLQLLLMNFHLAIEGRRFRQYVDTKQDKLELAVSERKMEFDRLRKFLYDQLNRIKVEESENAQQRASPPVSTPVAANEILTPNGGDVGQRAVTMLPKQLDRDNGFGKVQASLSPYLPETLSRQHSQQVRPNDFLFGGKAVTVVKTEPGKSNGAGLAAGRMMEKPISQMDGDSGSDDNEDPDEDDEDDSGPMIEERSNSNYDSDGGQDSQDDNMDIDGRSSARHEEDDEEEDDEEEDEEDEEDEEEEEEEDEEDGGEDEGEENDVEQDKDQISEEDEESTKRANEGVRGHLGSKQPTTAVKFVGMGASANVPVKTKGEFAADSPEHVALREVFVRQWSELTNIETYAQEHVRVKGPEGDVPFAVHEMYWSVQSFGGSGQLKNWKMAANDMMTRKTGRPCIPVPGRGYGYIPRAWERWRLSEYEIKFGASNIPREYDKPAFVATRKAMQLASGISVKDGADRASLIKEITEKVKNSDNKRQKTNPRARPTAHPSTAGARAGASRARTSSSARPRNRSGRGNTARSRPRKAIAGGDGACSSRQRFSASRVTAESIAASLAATTSPETAFLLKLLQSKTMVRGLTKEEMTIRRRVDQKHKHRLQQLKLRTEPLGTDRFKRQYWVLGNDFSVIWVQDFDVFEEDKDKHNEDAAQNALQKYRPPRTRFSVISSAAQVQALLDTLDLHGIRENQLLLAIDLYRHELSAGMGASISSPLTAAEDEHDDPSFSAALAKTLESMSTASIPAPAIQIPEVYSHITPSKTSPEVQNTPQVVTHHEQLTGHWERDASGKRVWVTKPPAATVSQGSAAEASNDVDMVLSAAPSDAPVSGQDNVASPSQVCGSQIHTDERNNDPVVADLFVADGMSLATIVSYAAKFLETAQPLDEGTCNGSRTYDFVQSLYAESTIAEMKAAQEYFGIVSDQHNADAAALVLSDGMCKIKGDLLLIEMAVNEEAMKSEFMELRTKWLESVRDARRPVELLAAAREFIENVEPSWVKDWYFDVTRPWDMTPLPFGAPDQTLEETAKQDESMAAEEQAEDEMGVGAEDGASDQADGDKPFAAGDLVEAKGQGYRGWWEATIKQINHDGTMEIRWSTDPQVDLLKKPSEVRRKKTKAHKSIKDMLVEPAQPLIDWQAERMMRVGEKERKAPVSTAKVALVVYGFDEAVRYDRSK